jgi:osmotically-inducible protein OsmY
MTLSPDATGGRRRTSDRHLESAITAAFVRNAQLDGKQITVTTDAGHVTLEGSVHSWPERRQADTAAWSAPGVTAVTNHLQVWS